MSDVDDLARTVPFLVVTVFAVGAMTSPPDPTTQLYWLGSLVVVGAPVALWLAFRGGYERIGARPPRKFDLLAGVLLGSVAATVTTAPVPDLGYLPLGVTAVSIDGAVTAAVFLPVHAWASLYGGGYRIRQAIESRTPE